MDQREKLIRQHMPMVRKLVNTVARKLPAHVSKDDLRSAGYLGLLRAVDNYNPDSPARFESWANTKIMGAIKDELRTYDAGTRTMRKMQRELDQVEVSLGSELGRPASRAEIAKHMGLTDKELDKHNLAYSLAITTSLDFACSSEDSEGCTIMDKIEDQCQSAERPLMAQENVDQFTQQVKLLPERERMIIHMYYYDDLTLKEIGANLGVTESRISQLHARALDRMRQSIEESVEQLALA